MTLYTIILFYYPQCGNRYYGAVCIQCGCCRLISVDLSSLLLRKLLSHLLILMSVILQWKETFPQNLDCYDTTVKHYILAAS